MSQTDNKVAIVTGASKGIGADIAERLASNGFTEVVNFSGSTAAAQALVRKMGDARGHAITAQADVGDSASVKRMFDTAEATCGGVDVVVNNAGIMKLVTLADNDDALFDSQIAVNFKGTFNMLRQAAKRWRNGGRFINSSSSAVRLCQSTCAVYAATKAGVEAMTQVLAKELRGRNITVNSIAPGPTGTDLFLTGKAQELVDRIAKLAPLERLGQPSDIAAVAASLASSEGGCINGQTLLANGGIT